MKRIVLFLSLLMGFVSYSQNQTQSDNEQLLNPDLQLDVLETNRDLQRIKDRKSLQKAKTSGGLINQQFIGFADTIYNLYGGSGVFGGLFQVPLYGDSTLKQEFSNSTSYIDQHAVGMTYDPTSRIWGSNTFSEADPVTIDSVHIFAKYDTPSTIPTPSGDSLIVEVTWAPMFPGSSRDDAFQGVFYSPNANNPDTCRLENPKVDVTSPGVAWKLQGTNYLRTGIELTANDIATSTDPTTMFGIAVNQVIPAGNLVAVSFTFKSAYGPTTSVGDTAFSTADVENTKIPSFAARLASENVSGGTRYFCDPFGRNSTSQLTNRTLYQTQGNFRDGMFAGRVTGGYFTFLTVSGTSTLATKEQEEINSIELYPNPSSGRINLSLAQSGSYNLSLINILGQKVYSELVLMSSGEHVSRDFSGLPEGIYILNIKREGFVYSTKLTLNR